ISAPGEGHAGPGGLPRPLPPPRDGLGEQVQARQDVITVGREDERVENAVREVELYGRMVNASVESRRLDPEDFRSCVGDAAELFAGDHEHHLDVGGGVRAPAASCRPRRCWPWPIWTRTWSPCTPWRSTPRG
ncbi:MAG: hypothetical protein RXR06_11500, partial [Thermoproteus sp.]